MLLASIFVTLNLLLSGLLYLIGGNGLYNLVFALGGAYVWWVTHE